MSVLFEEREYVGEKTSVALAFELVFHETRSDSHSPESFLQSLLSLKFSVSSRAVL